MKKQYRWIVPVLFLGLICLIYYFKPVFAVNDNLETSVVSLIIKSNQAVIWKDDYFELIDFEEYQLVSLNSLAPGLEIEFNFNREKNMVTVYSRRFNREVQVYMNEQRYVVEGRNEWENWPPVTLNGGFYVCTSLVEYVAQVQVTWAARYQELTIQADRLSLKATNNSKSSLKTGTDTDNPSDGKILEGPAFSFGTVEYELSWENRQNSSGDKTTVQTLGIRSDGRAGPWTLSLGGNLTWDYLTQSIDPALTSIRAKYHENNQLVILGDSEVSLEETLGTKDLRGILWATPNWQLNNKLLSFTVISGIADSGDKVKLLVNDELTGELTVDGGNSYVFTNVPLKLRRINVVKTIITKNNGETVETCRKVAAFPGMLESGNYDFLVASGSYRQVLWDPWSNDLSSDAHETFSDWEGNVTAFKADYGINDRITLNSEIARIRPFDLNGGENGCVDGADLGVAFRFGEGMFYTLDWLIGGKEDQSPLENGWSSSLLYEMENGSFEAVSFYVPDGVSKGLRNEIEGKGFRILSEVEYTKNITIKANVNQVESLSTPGNSWSEINLKLNSHTGIETQIDHSVSVTAKNTNTLSQTQNQTGITFEHWKREKGFSHKEAFGFSNILHRNDSSSRDVQSFSWEESFLKNYKNSWLFGFAINPVGNWWDNAYHDLTVTTDAELKWNRQNIWAGLKGTIVCTNEAGPDSGFTMNTLELSGNAKYYLTQSTHCFLKYGRVFESLNDSSYTAGAAGFAYQWPKNSGKVWAEVEYVSPVGGQSEPQWSPSLGFSKVFASGFEIVLEMERNYQSLWSDSYEQVYRLSLRQALGFGNGQVRTFPYSTDENLAVIGGVVYLDENGNGKHDPGEKGLAGTKVKLDGSIVETNCEGNYLFSSVDPGIYRLNIDLRSLPADYTPVTGEQLIKLKRSENMFLDFGVTMNGSISGKVFADPNANGQLDSGEQPLAWVGILLDGGKKYFTLQDGSFYIENVPLGTHTVSVIPETVPNGMEVKQTGEYPVHITEKSLDVMDVVFPVVFKFTE